LPPLHDWLQKIGMHPNFTLSSRNEFTRSVGFAATYRGIQVPGAMVSTAVHPSVGSMVLQELQGKDFSLLFQVFDIRKPCTLFILYPSSYISAALPLKNSLHCSFRHFKQPLLQQGQFALYHCQEQEVSLQFAKPGLYESIIVNWSANIAAEFVASFALLRNLRDEKNLRRSFSLTGYNKTANFRSLGMAHALLRFPQKDQGAAIFFEHKLKEYLLSLLIAAERTPSPQTHINNSDLQRIHTLYDKLRQHPEQRFLISDLARELNMGEKKLKRLFAQVFGMPIFEFHLATRMKEAHRLLEENEYNSKQIAAMVGYQLTTSFITKFREYYGYPPSEIRKKP